MKHPQTKQKTRALGIGKHTFNFSTQEAELDKDRGTRDGCMV